MAFDPTSANEKGKRFSVAHNTDKETRVIVLKATEPVALSGGIVSDVDDGIVGVTACKYVSGTHVKTAPAIVFSGLTGQKTLECYVDPADNTIKLTADDGSTPAGSLKLAEVEVDVTTNAITVTMDRKRLRVLADAGTDDLD